MNESKKIETPADPPPAKLLDRMVEAKQLSVADASILSAQSAKGKPELVQSEDSVLRWLAGEYHLNFTTLDNIEPDRELLSLFPARVLLKEELLPLQRLNGVVQVATSRLFATQGLDTLKTLTGLKIQPVLAPAEAIRREMKTRLGIGADTIDTLDEDAPLLVVDELGDENADLESAAEDASIIKFVNQVFTDAIELRSSDIHLEPFEEEFRIRYRIDGVLQEVPVPGSTQALSTRHRFPHQDSEPSQHRRKAPAPGRTHQAPPGQQRSGRARFHHPHAPRRSGRPALAPAKGNLDGHERIGHGR